MNVFSKAVNKCAEKVYEVLGKSSGKLLLTAGIIGISMSSAIQALAILCNKKYPASQKAFMVPQELGEGAMSVMCLFLITKPCQALVKKLVNTGKILPKNLSEYLIKNNAAQRRGKIDFSIRKEIKTAEEELKKSDVFTKSDKAGKEELLGVHETALENLEEFEDAALAVGTTAAGMLSACFAVPLLRNNIASHYQKKYINTIGNKPAAEDIQEKHVRNIELRLNRIYRSGDLKI